MKNFLLGVGAQKAGTTWLYDFLKNSKNTNLGPVKEWHIWDWKFREQFANFEVKKSNLKDNSINKIRFQMQNEDKFYENYFLSLTSDSEYLTGDITPSYCCLNSNELNQIKSKLLDVGFKVKVVYLMRDPVERCWSATRMIIKLNNKYKNISNNDANLLFLNYYKSTGFKLRTNYEFTVKNLLSSFDTNQIYFGFYENLFEKDNISNLLDFLEINNSQNITNKISNASPIFQLDPDLSKLCKDFYLDTYKYCNKTFPITNKLWN